MRIKTKKVYYCDYCNKHGLLENAMIWHQKICKKNPDNKRECYGCKFLEKVKTQDYNDMGYESRIVKVLHCSKFDKFLHTPQNSIKQNMFEFTDPMPVECDDFIPEWEEKQ